MKKIIAFMFLALITFGVKATGQIDNSKLKKPILTEEQVTSLIEDKEFTFVAERVLPSTELTKVAYDIRVEPGEVRCWVPGEESFVSTDFTYKTVKNKKETSVEIRIKRTLDSRQYKITFEIQSNGQAQATVTRLSANGKSHTMLGYIKPKARDL